MAQKIKDVMTRNPVMLPGGMSVLEAARRMRDESIGDIVVVDGDHVLGIVTDRDLVVRVLAEGHDPRQSTLEGICTRDLTTVTPEDDVDTAVTLMREKSIRRLPVIERAGRPVGIVSLGDLAQEKDPQSALGQISQAPANN
jgi:CBS domain-containing protein